jgi:Cft2 family RNA processing exonuclease
MNNRKLKKTRERAKRIRKARNIVKNNISTNVKRVIAKKKMLERLTIEAGVKRAIIRARSKSDDKEKENGVF